MKRPTPLSPLEIARPRHGRTATFTNPLDIECDWCFEKEGHQCCDEKGLPLPTGRVHAIRIRDAKAA